MNSALPTGIKPQWLAHENNAIEVLVISNPFCDAVIAYQGAQVLHYQAKQKPPLLWLSTGNRFQSGKAIRGGIPLCFPWFGAHPDNPALAAHGFARNLLWQLAAAEHNMHGHRLRFVLSETVATRSIWDYAFKLSVEIQFGAQLEVKLQVSNTDSQPFEFGFAWHSYFAIQDICQTQLHGLEHVPFLDQLVPAAGYSHVEHQPVGFLAETDRIYQQAGGHYQITAEQQTPIQIDAPACSSVVVWNPWAEKATRLGDMPENSWKNMLCVECGQVGEANVQLQAGQTLSYPLILSY